MKVAALVLAIILSGLNLYALQSPEGTKIEGVEPRNNRRIPSDTIKYHIQTKAGAVLNFETIRRDVKELYATNYFDDIQVIEEPGKSGGIIVVFQVKEKPLIRSIDFTGLNT